ncbi:MAG: hypothetical protein LIO80_11280 [Lachnospiraceae bacterium]|nr:hypothetical protein [Lachnospiraceae bacterium]
MRNTDKWQWDYIEEKFNTVLELLQDIQEEMKVRELHFAYLQEESRQNDALLKQAEQLIREKGLEDKYNERIKGRV